MVLEYILNAGGLQLCAYKTRVFPAFQIKYAEARKKMKVQIVVTAFLGGEGWYWGLNSASSLLGRCSTHQPFFMLGISETGSHKLLAQAGFKPLSSSSLPPE
jgi:hypothetical protein